MQTKLKNVDLNKASQFLIQQYQDSYLRKLKRN